MFSLALALLFSLALAGCHGSSGSSAALGSGRVLVITDLHFNPYADPNVFAQLEAENSNRWDEIFRSSNMDWGDYGQGTTYRLWDSTLTEIADEAEDVDAVMYLGDLLCHNFNEQFYQYLGSEDEDRLHAFINKTYLFILSRLRAALPGRGVAFVIGNNDFYCGDYQLEPGGPFLAELADLIDDGLGLAPDEHDAFMVSFQRGGYYEMSFPETPDHQIIAVNSIFFSINYTNACGTEGDVEPGREELDWLEKRLQAARAANRKVWILQHMPPGLNIYGTVHNQMAADGSITEVQDFWAEEFGAEYYNLLDRYTDVLVAGFSGHTHQDDFRARPTRLVFNKIAPAVSPVFGNNPAFTLVRYDRSTLAVQDYAVHYLDLAAANQSAAGAIWAKEYDYTDAYDLTGLNALSLFALHQNIGGSTGDRVRYSSYYDVSNTTQNPMADANSYRAYWCGQSAWLADDFLDCYNDVNDWSDRAGAGD